MKMYRKKLYDLRIRDIVFYQPIKYWNRFIKRLSSFLTLVVFILITLTTSYADKPKTLSLEVTNILLECKKEITSQHIKRLNLLVNRNNEKIREAFKHEVLRIGGTNGTPIDAKKFYYKVFSKVDK